MPKVPRTPPSDRLDALSPDVHVLPAGTTVWRIYFRGGRHPTRWSRFRRVGPTDARFDHQPELPGEEQERAVLYAAGEPVTCFAEVFQRTRLVNRRHNEPWLVGFQTEIAVSSASIDLHDKLRAYRRNGVQEYVVWCTQEQRIDWFELTDGEYRPLPDDSDVVRSRVFPGLRLAFRALLDGNLAAALAELQNGLDSDEHRRFAVGLAGRA